jgi:MoxR-like ATPase
VFFQEHQALGTASMTDQPNDLIELLRQNISRVVLGKADTVRLAVVALLAGEHILLEDVPGVGKTLVGKAIARSLAGVFHRLQFTPDLLPADITGSSLYNSQTHEFVFSPGPIFANVVLADEINRATPRTQSALLESMSDRQVSADGQTHPLPRPFMVIATQNPVEFEGTYPLPESQLDRFLLRLPVGYPEREVELQVLTTHREGEPVDSLAPALDCEQVAALQAAVRQVAVEDSINGYVLDIVQATRRCDELNVGVSTRGALALYRAAQAAALVAGRQYVVPDDVKHLTVPVLAHRVIPKGYLHGGQREAVESLIERLVEGIHVPG